MAVMRNIIHTHTPTHPHKHKHESLCHCCWKMKWNDAKHIQQSSRLASISRRQRVLPPVLRQASRRATAALCFLAVLLTVSICFGVFVRATLWMCRNLNHIAGENSRFRAAIAKMGSRECKIVHKQQLLELPHTHTHAYTESIISNFQL